MIAKWVAVLLLASPAAVAGAQQQSTPAKPSQDQQQQTQEQNQRQDPLAAAARRAREKQQSQQHAAKVWDNDNLPATTGTVSVVGKSTGSEAATETTEQATSAVAGSPAGEKTTATSAAKAELQKELQQAKAHLKSIKTDLDIATRTYQLDQQTFYSNPNYASDTQGAVKLKVEEGDIQAKKQEVDDLQKNVDGLTAKLKELEGGSTGSTKTPQ